mgnify:CR=1 FL=1
MTIKEQIEIARLIASGTPREVAILEFKTSPGYDKKTGAASSDEPSPHEKSKARAAAAKAKQDELQASQKEISDKRIEQQAKMRLRGARKDAQSIRNNLADRVSNAKFSKINTKAITTKGTEGATAVQQATGNVARAGVATTKNVAKGAAKAVVGAKNLISGFKDRAEKKKLYKLDKKLDDLKKKKKALQSEEFIQEVEDKKDSKAKKVIDIMKGKNSVKINPDMKEDTVVVQDASGKDFVEIVDIITPQKVRSDWRKEINVAEASAAWQRKEGKSKSGGLNEKGRKSYERQNPGSDLKAPSKKVGNKRRASFCARMKGMKKKLTSAKTARDPNSRINKSLRAWNC